MPKLNLTERAIAKMAAPDPSGRQLLYWDETLRGFAVLVSGKTNQKTFVVQRDLPNGVTRRLTVAAVTELSLEKARDRAADMLDDLRRGIDPKRKTENPTLRSTLEDYLAARKDLRPASIRVYRQIEKYLANWLDWKLTDITPERVEDRHRALADQIGPPTANGVMRTLRVLWNFAAERTTELPPHNPVRRLRRQWYPEPPRERVLRSEQLPKFYKAVCELANPIARDYLLLMLFTGLRKSEAASLRWDDIDLTERIIRIPAARAKGKRKLDLPMSDMVSDMLVARRSLGDAKFVFPGRGGTHIGSPGHWLVMVAESTSIRVSAHDLRRTFITVAESADISPMALKVMVGHSLGGDVTANYVRMTTERLREPVARVAARLKQLCGIVDVVGDKIAKLSRP